VQIDTVESQMGTELFGQKDGVAFRQFVSVSGEAGAGDDFTRGVLETRQIQAHHLRPIAWNILEEFSIRGYLAEELPGPFYSAELLLSDRLFLARPCQAVVANDARDRVVAYFQIELTNQAFGSKAGALS
jgi:hypothetical protein